MLYVMYLNGSNDADEMAPGGDVPYDLAAICILIVTTSMQRFIRSLNRKKRGREYVVDV